MPVPAAKADARKPASARAAARGGGKGQELQRGGELSIAFSAFAGSLLRPRGRVRFAVVGAARASPSEPSIRVPIRVARPSHPSGPQVT